MEHSNILDNEERRSFLYGNRSLFCFVGSLLFLGGTACGLEYLQGYNLSRTLEIICHVLPFVVLFFFTLVGCYFGIRGIRMKEVKRWRSILGLLGNLLFVLGICFILIYALLSKEDQLAESPKPPMEEQRISE